MYIWHILTVLIIGKATACDRVFVAMNHETPAMDQATADATVGKINSG